MPIMNLPPLPGKDAKIEDVIDHVAMLQKSVNFLMSGNLDSNNAAEFGGWKINRTELYSKNLDVGMSTDDALINNVRFWAGGMDKETAPFRVFEDGSGVATGWQIQSKDGSYPRLEMSAENDMLTAYGSETSYINFKSRTSEFDISPSIEFVSESDKGTLIYVDLDDVGGDTGMYLSSTRDIILVPGSGGPTATVHIVGDLDVGYFSNVKGIDMSLGPTDLQAVFDAMWNAINTHTHSFSYSSHSHSIPTGSTGSGGGGSGSTGTADY